METLLAEGCNALKENKFSESERSFSEVVRICQNQEPRDYIGSRPAFLGLAEIYMKYGSSELLLVYQRQEMLIKAVVLCHYVMNITRKCGNGSSQDNAGDEEGKEVCATEMLNRLHCMESELMKSMNVTCEDVTESTTKHKMALVNLRDGMKEEILKVETIVDFDQPTDQAKECFARKMTSINNTICGCVKDIVDEMITECQHFLGNPPCEFVALGLGSFAFGTMTPYSDLEWAILLDVENEQFKNYFRDLSHLLHFKVASLGETIVPSVMIKSLNSEQDSWFYDDVTPRGFAVDGAMEKACKTPLGRRDDSGDVVFELIHSPEKMAEFQNLEWSNKSFELAASLRSFQVVYSSESTKGVEIIQRYKQELRNQLECNVEEHSSLSENDDPLLCDDNCCLPKEVLLGEEFKVCESRYTSCSRDEVTCLPTLTADTSDILPKGAEKTDVSCSNMLDSLDKRNYEKNRMEKTSMEFKDEVWNNDDKISKIPRKGVSLISVTNEDIVRNDTVKFQTLRSNIPDKEDQEKGFHECDSQIDAPSKHDNFSEHQVDGNGLITMRKQHVKTMMANDIPRYHLHDVLCTSDTEGMIYNVKKDLYRQPERLLCILFLDFGVESSNVYEGLEELQRNDVISEQVKRNLVVALSIACELRLRAYLEHDRQLEELDIPSSISSCHSNISSLVETAETISTKAKLDRLVRFYRIVLPFLEKVQENDNPMNWRLEDLEVSSYYNAFIYLRLLRYDDAKYYTLKAIHENPERATNWRLLARLLEKQGKYDEAFHSLLKSFCIFFAGNNDVINLCDQTKEEDRQKGSGDLPCIEDQVKRVGRSVFGDSQQMHFLLIYLQRMALSSFFSSQYQRAWRYFRIVYYLVQSFPSLRRKDTVPSVFTNIALCLSVAGRYQEAIDILEFILSNDSLSSLQVPKVQDNLGNAYFHIGNYPQALAEYRKALKIRRKYYPTDGSPFLVVSLVNIGNVLSKIGQVTESIKYYNEALQVIQHIYKNPFENYAELCYSGIGKNLISLGKNKEALEYCEKSVEIGRTRRGYCDHKSYATILAGLGNCYLYLKRFDDAVMTYEESVDIFQRISWMDEDAVVLPSEVSIVNCNLAVALHQQGKSDAALRWLQEAEDKMASCVNLSHSDVGVVLHTKAQIFRSQGKHEEAKEVLEKALGIFVNVFGSDCSHPSIITTLSSLAAVLIRLRHHVKAIDSLHHALHLLSSSTIPDDALIQLKITANKNLGYAHYQLKQIPDALVYYKRALSIWKKHAESSSSDIDQSTILSLRIEAGNAYIRGGNERQAMQLYQAAVDTPVSLSRGFCDLKQVALTLAAMQTKAGLLRKAIESFKTAVSLHMQTSIEENDLFVVKCFQNQAALYKTIGDRENACLFSEKALGVQLLVTNSKPHQGTAKLLAQVAETWSHSNIQKAVEFCERSLQMIKNLGDLKGLEYNVLSDLGFYYHLHGSQVEDLSEQRRLYEEAERNYNRALELRGNEATLFNLIFLLMSNSRFDEANRLLKTVPEKCDKESRLGFDDRDVKLINRKLREKLFSRRGKNDVVVCRAVVLAYFLKVQCYEALADDENALSEASKLERFVSKLENPESTDYKLLAYTYEELNNPMKAKIFFEKCSNNTEN